MTTLEHPCGCKTEISFIHMCKHHSQKHLLELMPPIGSTRSIDLDDIEYLLEKET